MPLISIGLSTIKIGNPESNGGMGLTLAPLGYTLEGSAGFDIGEPEETPFYAEEVDDPIYIKRRKGKSMINFQVMDADADVLVKTLGGSATVVSGIAAWVTATAYKVGDFVLVSSVYYRCITDHTSSATITQASLAHWQVLPAQPKTWAQPFKPPVLDQSVEIIPEIGFKIQIPRCSMSASVNTKLSKTGLQVIDVKGWVLQPKLAGLAPISMIG